MLIILEDPRHIMYFEFNPKNIEKINMTRIIVELDENKAAILKSKAKKFGLLPEQFVTASIEDLISQPDQDIEAAIQNVLDKNQALYQRLS